MNPPTSGNEPVLAYIGLGANLGQRIENLCRAVHLLDAAASSPAGTIVLSSLYETSPVGGPSAQPMYLNAVAGITTSLPPQALLRELLAIEQSLGRIRAIRHESRIIDLDLLLYGTQQIIQPGLVVPHPAITHRRFVLEPLAELAPGFLHPESGRTLRQLALEAREHLEQRVSRIDSRQWLQIRTARAKRLDSHNHSI